MRIGLDIKHYSFLRTQYNRLYLQNDKCLLSSDCILTIKNGDKFPNAMLGDLLLTIAKSATTVLQIQDPARFINKDGAIDIDFGAGFAGTIWAIGKKVGL